MKILTTNYLKRSHNNGFTLIEVLVGIIMATAFVLVAVQAIAISAVYRVQAQRKAEALLAIQDDVENIRFVLLTISPYLKDLNGQPLSEKDAQDKIQEICNEGYASAVMDDNESPPKLNNSNQFPSAPSSLQLLNKTYNMTRTVDIKIDPSGEPQPHVMTLDYEVSDPDSGRVIAELYTEVIPYAAFDCE